jgi:hypothetical protein
MSQGPTGFSGITKAQAKKKAFEPVTGTTLFEHGAHSG